MVTKRRITDKDKKSVAAYIKDELKSRKDNEYRKKHELIWKEVDRQVYMESMAKVSRDPNIISWKSAIELGELSRASEILTADIRNITFPQNRSWFDPHAKIEGQMDENGNTTIDPLQRKKTNDQLRALMSQQHLDFSLKSRVDLSVKESLHHGGYVAEVKWELLVNVSDGSNVQAIASPVWYPHSMWKCYPENRFINNMFYSGSMIICEKMRYVDLMDKVGKPNWFDLTKIDKKKDTDDVELLKYYGDITINRSDGDIHYPNSVFYVVDDRIVYYEANETPYPRIIYNGYERLDVRDPYFISPLVKMSPTQKIASVLANRLIDSVEKWVDPPVEYDGNDADLIASGGPDTSPGAKNPRRSTNSWAEMKVGDPQAALMGVQFFMGELQKGTAVDAIRSGMTASTEQTATEVERTRQGTINFVDKHELQGLRPFLYMQHELNKRKLRDYKFYNPAVDAPDFEILNKEDLPVDVHFEIVGSRGILEEQQRQQKTMQTTQFWMQFPQTASKLNLDALMKQSFEDAGNKNAEMYLVQQQPIDPQQVQQIMQQVQQHVQELQQELQQYQIKDQTHALENQQNDLEKEQLQTKLVALAEILKIYKEHTHVKDTFNSLSTKITQ